MMRRTQANPLLPDTCTATPMPEPHSCCLLPRPRSPCRLRRPRRRWAPHLPPRHRRAPHLPRRPRQPRRFQQRPSRPLHPRRLRRDAGGARPSPTALCPLRAPARLPQPWRPGLPRCPPPRGQRQRPRPPRAWPLALRHPSRLPPQPRCSPLPRRPPPFRQRQRLLPLQAYTLPLLSHHWPHLWPMRPWLCPL